MLRDLLSERAVARRIGIAEHARLHLAPGHGHELAPGLEGKMIEGGQVRGERRHRTDIGGSNAGRANAFRLQRQRSPAPRKLGLVSPLAPVPPFRLAGGDPIVRQIRGDVGPVADPAFEVPLALQEIQGRYDGVARHVEFVGEDAARRQARSGV